MRTKEFTPGDLAWITTREEVTTRLLNGLVPCASGYPERISIKPGSPVTVIRQALAKDYGIYGRHTYKGRSTAAKLAEESWLVLYEGAPLLLDGECLNKRPYTPRKKPT